MGKLLRFSRTVYVPAERVSALESIKALALTAAAGYTATPGEGGWVSPKGNRHVQPIVKVEVWSDSPDTLDAFAIAAIKVLKGYGEQEVLFTVTGPDGSTGAVA